MARPTGEPKIGGRKKGVPNRTTTNIRDTFQLLVEGNLTQLQSDFNELKAAERIKYTLEMAKFCLPTLKAIDYVGEITVTERPKILFIDKV